MLRQVGKKVDSMIPYTYVSLLLCIMVPSISYNLWDISPYFVHLFFMKQKVSLYYLQSIQLCVLIRASSRISNVHMINKSNWMELQESMHKLH